MNQKQLDNHGRAVFDLFGFPQCYICRHYLDGKKCSAFARIPDEILRGDNDHKKPYPSDNGIQFEEKPNED